VQDILFFGLSETGINMVYETQTMATPRAVSALTGKVLVKILKQS